MNEPEPFRWGALTPGAKVGVFLVGLFLAALVATVLAIVAGFAWDAVQWAWS